MADVNCIECGKKVGTASKPSIDATDSSKAVKDYAVLCNQCSGGDRKTLSKKTIDKMKTTEATATAIAVKE